jgi:NADPH:quinone reductase-like Zn-dependent oxidoreductase
MAKQIVISRAGGPEVLVARDIEPTRVAANEVRIRVAAAGVNFADVVGRIGNYPDAPPMPYAPGYEVSGTIAEVGADVTGLAIGDRVCALTRFGGYAEEAITRAEVVWKLPAAVDLVTAAGVPVTYLTARTCLFEAGALRAGKSVLILGGAGGVGSAAIQLARTQGVTILATAGSAAKCEWMRKEGVHHPINYNDGDVKDAVLAATGGRGVDLVLDPVGGRGITKSMAMCAPLGRVVLFGASSISPGKRRSIMALLREGPAMRFFNLIPVFNMNVGIHCINMLHLSEKDPALMARMMSEMLAEIAAGTLAPIISARFPLTRDGAAEAHDHLQDRKNIGKVLLVAGAGPAA